MALLELAILFVVLAIVAGVLGQRSVAGMPMGIVKWLIVAFFVLTILSMVM